MTEKLFHCSFSRTVCEDLHIGRTAVGRAIFFMALRAWGSQGLSWGDVSSIKMWEDQSNPKGWSDKQLPKPVFSCPAVEQTQHRLISWRSVSCEAHTVSSPVKMSPCTSRTGASGPPATVGMEAGASRQGVLTASCPVIKFSPTRRQQSPRLRFCKAFTGQKRAVSAPRWKPQIKMLKECWVGDCLNSCVAARWKYAFHRAVKTVLDDLWTYEWWMGHIIIHPSLSAALTVAHSSYIAWSIITGPANATFSPECFHSFQQHKGCFCFLWMMCNVIDMQARPGRGN